MGNSQPSAGQAAYRRHAGVRGPAGTPRVGAWQGFAARAGMALRQRAKTHKCLPIAGLGEKATDLGRKPRT